MSDADGITIAIGGMHCQNCVNAVEKKLSSLAGVTGVAVNLAKGEAVVKGGGVDVAAVKSAIEELGFDAGEIV